MVVFRLGPILIYHYNLILVLGFVLALFVVYRAAKRKDYNLEKVLDWVLSGTVVSILFLWGIGKASRLSLWFPPIPDGAGRVVFNFQLHGYSITRLPAARLFTGFDLRVEVGILAFVVFTYFLFRYWRWPMFPPLDFEALGGVFFYLVFGVIFSSSNLLSDFLARTFSVPQWLANFAYFSGVFYLLNRKFKINYKEGSVLGLGFILSLRPLLILAGGIVLVVVEWEKLREGLLILGRLLSEGERQRAEAPETVMTKEKDTVKEQELKKQEKELEERLEELEEQDPRSYPERTLENAPEEDADEAWLGAQVGALKKIFRRRLENVRAALRKLKGGSYGVCDRCGERIDPARLKAKTDARYCLKCAEEMEE